MAKAHNAGISYVLPRNKATLVCPKPLHLTQPLRLTRTRSAPTQIKVVHGIPSGGGGAGGGYHHQELGERILNDGHIASHGRCGWCEGWGVDGGEGGGGGAGDGWRVGGREGGGVTDKWLGEGPRDGLNLAQ